MDSTLVIKVKYGDTLRRFNALVDDNQQLNLDFDGLRAKIRALFNFQPDAQITLKYIDEDGDMVTLVEDDDLRDVMRQRLKFLKIDVQLSDGEGAQYAKSSGSSTPSRLPRVQYSLSNMDASVTEALKLVPEPVKEAISKLSVDFASKATSSNPVLSEVVEFLTKLGQSYISPVSQSQSGYNLKTDNGTSEIPVVPAVSGGPNIQKDAILPMSRYVERCYSSPSKSGPEGVICNVTRGVGSTTIPVSGHVDLNQDPPVDSGPYERVHSEPVASYLTSDNKNETEKSVDDNVSWKSHLFGASSGLAGSRWCSAPKPNLSTGVSGSPFKECPFNGIPLANDSTVPAAHCRTSSSLAGSRWCCPPKPNNSTGLSGSPYKECPFSSSMPMTNNSTVPAFHHRIHPFKRSFTSSDAMGGMFHKGVRCDGCGVHPITGPRFKSKVKDNYDLCSICFAEMGNEGDYIRMDRPVSYRPPRPCKGLYDHKVWVAPPTVRPKLDSRFISDITVVDGTTMAPSTQFTKIWRMRNNGNFVWPRGTQLVWIGGDKFTDAVSLELEIPENGVPSDGQLDITVDFTAPKLPGRYISYWRMASSSGHKFGQRVWVLIQVDASLQDSVCDSLRGLNLNFPPDCYGSKGFEMPDMNFKPLMDDELLESTNSNKEFDSIKAVVCEPSKKDQDFNFPTNDALLVGQTVSASSPPEATASVSYPIINISGATLPVPGSYPVVESPASSVTVNENDGVEQILLKELEVMGFKQVDLNKEILRMNEYNLEQSVDDLCGVANWDPMLEELEEMGFCDTEVNMRLLKKNNGSIKRVVMDLISGQKA